MASQNRVGDESVGLTDIISNLPDEIREYILGYLPVSDAVKTSVLSQMWRYTWTKMAQLNLYFDEDMEDRMSRDVYFRLVVRVLLSHDGAIHKCVLRPKFHDLDGDMNTWLQLLSRKGIKDLTVYCHQSMHNFELPPSIFKCLGLSNLTLGKCFLNNSISFKGFPNLIRLDLSYVNVVGDMLEKLISNSPLEMLSIKFCVFYFSETDFRPRKNAISAQNLRVLDIVYLCNGLDFSYLKYTPNLKVASFTMDCWMDCIVNGPHIKHSNCFDTLRSMPKVKALTFDCRQHKTSASDIIPKKLPELLVNLTTVHLHHMDALSVDHISFMFCISRSSPNLHNLNIHLGEITDMYGRAQLNMGSLKPVTAYLELEAKEEIQTSITKMSITFERVDNANRFETEIALICRIISCSPSLGYLPINVSPSIEGSDSAMQEISRAMRQFSQASSNSISAVVIMNRLQQKSQLKIGCSKC